MILHDLKIQSIALVLVASQEFFLIMGEMSRNSRYTDKYNQIVIYVSD